MKRINKSNDSVAGLLPALPLSLIRVRLHGTRRRGFMPRPPIAHHYTLRSLRRVSDPITNILQDVTPASLLVEY